MSGKRKIFSVDENGISEFISEVRKGLNLSDGDSLELVQNYKQIMLVKNGQFCVICGSDNALNKLGSGKIVCDKCFALMCRIMQY